MDPLTQNALFLEPTGSKSQRIDHETRLSIRSILRRRWSITKGAPVTVEQASLLHRQASLATSATAGVSDLKGGVKKETTAV